MSLSDSRHRQAYCAGPFRLQGHELFKLCGNGARSNGWKKIHHVTTTKDPMTQIVLFVGFVIFGLKTPRMYRPSRLSEGCVSHGVNLLLQGWQGRQIAEEGMTKTKRRLTRMAGKARIMVQIILGRRKSSSEFKIWVRNSNTSKYYRNPGKTKHCRRLLGETSQAERS